MTELETIRFFELLYLVEKDLSMISTYHHDFERVRHAAKTAMDGRDVHWNNITQRIYYLSTSMRTKLEELEDLLHE